MGARVEPIHGSALSRPRVAILSLGGTILMTGDREGGVVPRLGVEELVSSVPGLGAIAEIEAEQLAQKPSCDISLSDLARVVSRIGEGAARGIAGFVIVQGTDTIEEAAFALDLMLPAGNAVVVTGAIRNPTIAGADGPANLVAAVQAAANPALAEYGVVVAFDSELHVARHAAKTDSIKGDAFASPLCGPVGRVVEDRVILFHGPPPSAAPSFVPDTPMTAAPVALLSPTIDDDGRQVAAARLAGYRGIVVAGMGAGHTPPEMSDRLAQVSADMPVVLCSRTVGGQVCRGTYGYKGAEIDPLGRGLISGGWLAPLKARVLLSIALTQGLDRESIAAALRPFDGG